MPYYSLSSTLCWPDRLVIALALLSSASFVSAAPPTDFATQIHPILAARCAPCHSGDKPPAGLSLASRETALKGGASGPAFKPGSADDSLLILKITGKHGPVMPPTGPPLMQEQVDLLRAWINEGANWPQTPGTPASAWVAPIEPKQPPLPESAEANPIDKFVAVYFARHGMSFGEPLSDALFARRVYLDLWGLPPNPAQLKKFLNNHDPRRREQLIDELLADSNMYGQNWISWWNDLLRNDMGVNYQGDRKSITPWLIRALSHNEPYDQMVSELVNPRTKDDPDGFLVGVNWRGTVNASQTPYMQAAQNTAQIFLGINLKCASCHDSFINRYKLRESYGMAALFSEQGHLELVRCDSKTGKFTGPTLLYPELGTVPEDATLEERHAAAARFFTDKRNGRVARTIVNRYWQHLIGRGLVEPVDEMDAQPWYPDLLDWIASDFTAHGNDLHYLLREILTSKTYQMPAVVSLEKSSKDYVFRGPLVRRLSAEQFIDTVSTITGEWPSIEQEKHALLVRDWQVKSSPLALAMGRPIRDQVFTTRDNRATTFQALELVNGNTLETMTRRGAQRLLSELPPAPENLFDSGQLRKGTVPFDVDITDVKQLWLLTQDAGSYDPSRTVAGWADVELTGPGGSKKLSELETLSKFQMQQVRADGAEPVNSMVVPLGTKLVFPLNGLRFTRMRGRVLIDEHSQPSDIAGSVRFFIFGQQPDPQRLVKVEGEPPVPFAPPVKSVDEAIQRLYLQLLCRTPNAKETEVARTFFSDGSSRPRLNPAGLEDLMWSLLMHPEFQYVY